MLFLSPGSLPLVPQLPEEGRLPSRRGWPSGLHSCHTHRHTSSVCGCPSPPNIGGDGGSEVTKLPNPVCLYKRDTYSPCGTAKSQFRLQGPLVPFQILTPPELAVEGLSQRTHARVHTHAHSSSFAHFYFSSVALPCSNHFTLFSAILNSFIPASSTTRDSLEERAGVSSSPPG